MRLWKISSYNTPMLVLKFLLYPVGLHTVALGVVHFFFAKLLDFRAAIPFEGPTLKPFRLFGIFYQTKRSDVHGIASVMNHTVSYVIVTIGVLDLLWTLWLGTPIGRILCIWIAGFWWLRASSQFYLGRRRGDWLIFIWFATLGLLHLALIF